MNLNFKPSNFETDLPQIVKNFGKYSLFTKIKGHNSVVHLTASSYLSKLELLIKSKYDESDLQSLGRYFHFFIGEEFMDWYFNCSKTEDYDQLKPLFLEEVKKQEYKYFNVLQVDNETFCKLLSIESVEDLISKKLKLFTILFPNLDTGSSFKMIISSFDLFYFSKFNRLTLNFTAIKFKAKSIKSVHNLTVNHKESEDQSKATDQADSIIKL